MAKLNRELAIRQADSGDWQTVSEWVRWMCKIEPKIMAKVNRSTIGDLGAWLEKGDKVNKVCGCLVGTVALKLVDERNSFKIETEQDWEPDLVRTKVKNKTQFVGEVVNAPAAVCELVKQRNQKFVDFMQEQTYSAGYAASELAVQLGQERAVLLIKREISKWLLHYRRERARNKERKLRRAGR